MKYNIWGPIAKALTGVALVYTLLNSSDSFTQTRGSVENAPNDSNKTLVGKLDSLSSSGDYTEYSLARKNVKELSEGEKSYLIDRLIQRESRGDPKALNTVIKKRKDSHGRVVHVDTIYSVGENQINVSPTGALTDYNIYHPTKQFLPEDMLAPAKNRVVRNWYLFKRIPKLLKSRGFVANVANGLAAYNTGVGNLDKMAKGDAITNFDRLPRITQSYIKEITGEDF